jgi:hypothetical protein
MKAIFDSGDLKDTGIEFDSHITLLYARKFIDKREILPLLRTFDFGDIPDLGGRNIQDFLEYQKNPLDFSCPVYDIFELSSFENDSGYVILKLKDNNLWYDVCSQINKVFGKYYNVTSDFSTYTPHLTLAELEPGLTEKYLDNETLRLVLRDSIVHFEDLVISYSREDSKEYDQYNITTNRAVDRFFRERELRSVEIE